MATILDTSDLNVRPGKAGSFICSVSHISGTQQECSQLRTLENSPEHSPHLGAELWGISVLSRPGLLPKGNRSQHWPTCAGVPGLNETPDNGIALVTGLLDTLALLLVKAVLQENSNIGLIFVRVLQRWITEGVQTSPATYFLQAPLVTETVHFSPMHILFFPLATECWSVNCGCKFPQCPSQHPCGSAQGPRASKQEVCGLCLSFLLLIGYKPRCAAGPRNVTGASLDNQDLQDH